MDDFVNWINAELDTRGWSRSEAARRGGISPSSIDKVIGGFSKPGLDFCRGISRAFGIPLEDVLRRAGILPSVGKLMPEVADWNSRLSRLAPGDREIAVRAIDGVLKVAESRPEYRTRRGESDPEE